MSADAKPASGRPAMTTDQNTATVRAIEAAWDANTLDALDGVP